MIARVFIRIEDWVRERLAGLRCVHIGMGPIVLRA